MKLNTLIILISIYLLLGIISCSDIQQLSPLAPESANSYNQLIRLPQTIDGALLKGWTVTKSIKGEDGGILSITDLYFGEIYGKIFDQNQCKLQFKMLNSLSFHTVEWLAVNNG